MPCSGDCITTPSFLVLLMTWFGWRLRIEIFLFSPFTSFWQVGEWSHCTVWCGTLGLLLELAFFAWETTWAKILTQDQLRRRGWRMPNRCYMCKAGEETRDHILLHCPKASILWQLVFALFHV